MVKAYKDDLLNQYIPEKQIREYYLSLMNSKDIRSCGSGQLVVFVDDINTDVIEAGITVGAYCDGMNFIDFHYDCNGGIEDNISKMYAILRNNNKYNLEDFFSRHKAYTNILYFLGQIKDMIKDRKRDNTQ